MTTPHSSWLLLIASLPTARATPRMRLWRAIKTLGCVSLRDGAYLLPAGTGHGAALEELARQTNAEGGQAWVVDLTTRSKEDDASFRSLFDRGADYTDFGVRVAQARSALAAQSETEIGRTVKRLRKELEELQRIDFFPNDAALAGQSAWADFQEAANNILAPGEPRGETRAVARLDAASYQGRTWATRRHLWVDRVASAWLIRRFIDPDATFLWLDSPAACPADALGFDFATAAFTHIGERVTFEVLLASFGLEADQGLRGLAALVHALDVGGPASPEAAGFEAILSGARSRHPDDDTLLAEIGRVLDSLHAYYSREESK